MMANNICFVRIKKARQDQVVGQGAFSTMGLTGQFVYAKHAFSYNAATCVFHSRVSRVPSLLYRAQLI